MKNAVASAYADALAGRDSFHASRVAARARANGSAAPAANDFRNRYGSAACVRLTPEGFRERTGLSAWAGLSRFRDSARYEIRWDQTRPTSGRWQFTVDGRFFSARTISPALTDILEHPERA